MRNRLSWIASNLAIAGAAVLTGCGQPGSMQSSTAGSATVAPTITHQPASVTVPMGLAAAFSVAISGNGTLTEQWFRNGVAISSATALDYMTGATSFV